MFSQNIESLIKKAVEDLDMFTPQSVENYKRDKLIELYWHFHPRFKSFKIFPRQNARVLDIGSGSGGLYFWKEYMEPVRTDLEMTALDLQKGEYFDNYNGYVVFNLDHGDMPFPESSFDYILLSHLIEHVKDWRALIRKCSKVLSDNGLLYIETPSKHTINLPSRDIYRERGYPCTTINFLDDLTHVETVDLDNVCDYAAGFNITASEKGFCRSPFLENHLLSFGWQHNDAEITQYGLWSKLIFSSYVILQKI